MKQLVKKIVAIVLLGLAPTLAGNVALAAGGNVHLDKAYLDMHDTGSLQRGAKLYVNYCLGCHSLKYQRYIRMAEDLNIDVELLKENLMFGTDKIHSTMTTALPDEQANKWFGTLPPDLSLVSRSRGADWLYTYLRSFYLDSSRPFGVNNSLFKDVGMPHVLWELQGWQKAKMSADGKRVEGFEVVEPGTLSAGEYDNAVRDLVGFMSYVGEPIQLERKRLGVWVLLFLGVFFVLAYLLKKEYWRDIH